MCAIVVGFGYIVAAFLIQPPVADAVAVGSVLMFMGGLWEVYVEWELPEDEDESKHTR